MCRKLYWSKRKIWTVESFSLRKWALEFTLIELPSSKGERSVGFAHLEPKPFPSKPDQLCRTYISLAKPKPPSRSCVGFFPEFILQWVESATGVCTPGVVREWVEGRHRGDHCARWNVQLHAHEVLLGTLHSCKVGHRVTASICILGLGLMNVRVRPGFRLGVRRP